MKIVFLRLVVFAVLAFCQALAATPVVFTSDTSIAASDSSYDGFDLTVTNCRVTIDGVHTFASIQVTTNGVITHSASTNGMILLATSAATESQTLTSTNPVTLTNGNVVLSSVVVSDATATIIYTNNADYLLGNLPGGFTSLQRSDTSSIPDGSTVSVSYNYIVLTNAGLLLTVTGDVTILSGGAINADAAGFGTSFGPGSGGQAGSPPGGGGGAYGGNGGLSSSNAPGGTGYGSPFDPAELGSAGGTGLGGSGGAGGGLIKITAGGKFTVDGLITVNGQTATNSRAGGGSGGCVRISAQTFAGAGVISANGGAGEPIHGGGGGGGRIAIDYSTNAFTGSMSAVGGSGWQRGGAGTISTRTTGLPGLVLFDNGGFAGATTPVQFTNAADLTIQGRAAAVAAASQTIGNLVIRSNSAFLPTATNSATLILTAQSNVIVEAGGSILLDGRGYSANLGPGPGVFSSVVGGGAGHGGYGGNGLSGATIGQGGNYNDSMTSPTFPGSGGRSINTFTGGSGGGALRLIVAGNLQLDGKISADATAGVGAVSGGGAGGSVWLSLGTLSGSGTISANGGAGGLPYGGGGSGGRIACTFQSNNFAGTLVAKGGPGAVFGAAGTIYTKANTTVNGSLLADNGGNPGANTVWDLISALNNVTITGRAGVTSTLFSVTLNNLTLGQDSTLAVSGGGTFIMSISGAANIATGAVLSADAVGLATTGLGASSTIGSGGGGHGGTGGRGFGGNGGFSYESSATPSTPGSRGGTTVGTVSGGGAMHLTVSGMLNLDGKISANGQSGLTNNSGGGSGGSIWLTLGGLAGAGTISADGGNGFLPTSGGGGGGRVAVYYSSNLFTGTYSAKGGIGFANGGAGTIYLKSNSKPTPVLTLDNGGAPGSATTLDITSFLELNILNGASVTSSFPTTITASNLTVSAGASIVGFTTFTLSGSGTISTGGLISVDGTSTSSTGAGTASSLGSGGGGHAGYGGRGFGALGGFAFGSILNPTSLGSRGGNVSQSGAPGGGALRINATGPVSIDGRLSANGFGNFTNSGGGSGGSIWVTCSTLSGTGAISADGGAGNLPFNGGGGGGRISLNYTSNKYTGVLSAKGGTGYAAGGAGTIYSKAVNSANGMLIVDNGGSFGTNTLMDSTVGILTNLQVTGGASLISSVSSLSLTTLNIASNSTLLGQASFNLTVNGSAKIATGAALSMDGSAFGPTPGLNSVSGAGGGGSAGYGGNGFGGLGGGVTGIANSPTFTGGGGGSTGGTGTSAAGGGALHLTVNGLLTLDGRISSNGQNAFSNNSGGAAGGSVWLSLQGFTGAGLVSADGGSGNLPAGGGGGGGRVAVQYTSNTFAGAYSAKGGAGYVNGGAGTIYKAPFQGNPATVLVDNGGLRGTNTAVSSSSSFNLTVQGGASAIAIGNPTDLLVRSNAWVAQTGTISIGHNVTVEAGGGFVVDGLGNDSGGTGLNSAVQAGGGGHAGYGGRHGVNTGLAFDSATGPTRSGSKGGNSSGNPTIAPLGGAGGGAFQLFANDMQLDGTISAAGKNGDFNSGGGSGGSVWLTLRTLSGVGSISANGGQGNGSGGGGGGGRIAIVASTNLLTGNISACGGNGFEAGGAGTVYLQTNGQPLAELRLANCAGSGAATPLSQTSGLAQLLKIGDGAIAEMQGALPVFSNVVVSTGGVLTGRALETNLNLAVEGDLIVQSGAAIHVNGEGFAQANGPGAGSSVSNKGSGGGYGGVGGASSSGATNGVTYGSVTMPVDEGSGGGLGLGGFAGGSTGGGALRVTVGNQFTVDGLISADGADAIQDDSGGGSGGSVWVTAGKLAGAGIISADGGTGELSGGGGGGGGRVAIYTPLNNFAGQFSAAGAPGAFSGGTGTVYFSSFLPGFAVVSQSPLGVISNTLSSARLVFNSPFNPGSIAGGDVVLITPSGPLPSSSLTLSALDANTLIVNFPVQHLSGDYQLLTGPAIEDLLGQSMSQVYTGSFTISLPAITGTVRDTNGAPVSGIVLQQTSGAAVAVTTDINGAYTIGVDPGWSGTIFPSNPGFTFAPGTRIYTSVTNSFSLQDYVMLDSITPSLTSDRQGSNLGMHWHGIKDINYQPQYSTNLFDWVDYGAIIPGTNGPIDLVIPTDIDPVKFFRLRASN